MKIAFLFPGQGSQSVGMLRELAKTNSIIQETFAQASAVLKYDLWVLTQDGSAENLNQTEKTQPALLTASIALWRLWQQRGGRMPDVLAGHSLGEYTALVCAGALEFEIAVQLVANRGQYMQEALSEDNGAMAAILGLDDEKIFAICEQASAETDQIVSPANFNSPGQVVISGINHAVEVAINLSKEAGAKLAKKLPVSVPSHSPLMQAASERLATDLAKIPLKMPKIPVIHNVDVTIKNTVDDIRAALVQQLYSPVQWVKTMGYLFAENVTVFVECGPGEVLTKLTKRLYPNVTALSMYQPLLFDLTHKELS